MNSGYGVFIAVGFLVMLVLLIVLFLDNKDE